MKASSAFRFARGPKGSLVFSLFRETPYFAGSFRPFKRNIGEGKKQGFGKLPTSKNLHSGSKPETEILRKCGHTSYACSVVTSPERTGTEWKGNEARKRAIISQNGEIRCKKPSVTGSAGRSMKYILPAVGRNRSMTKWCGSFAWKPLPHLLTKRTNRSVIKTATCLSGVHYRRNEP